MVLNYVKKICNINRQELFYMLQKATIKYFSILDVDFDAASTFSEYIIDKVLGEGGFGKVLLGIHRKTGE